MNTSVWSFSIDNSGANGLLKVTAAGTVPTGNIFWEGSTDSTWTTATNWSDDTGPVTGSLYAYINYGTPTFATGTSFNLRGLRVRGGTLTVSGGTFQATANSGAQSHLDATMIQTGGIVNINELEIGRTLGKTGSCTVSGGSFVINRNANTNYSLYLDTNTSVTETRSHSPLPGAASAIFTRRNPPRLSLVRRG